MIRNQLAENTQTRLPVIVLNGFTGAGKSTVLNHLLRAGTKRRTAVIVSNDGAGPAADTGANELTHTQEKVVRLALGAGCHELRADLLVEAGRLARQHRFDYLLIENLGVAAVRPVAQTFTVAHEAYGFDLPRRARLDTLVTVVDASRFLADFLAPLADPLTPVPGSDDPEPRAVADILSEQVEQANVLILNKTDLVSAAELARLRALLRQLNPRARLVDAVFGQVNPAELFDAGLFTGLVADAGQFVDPDLPDADGQGISAFRFRDERPFHPERLWQFLRESWPDAVLRSKGLFWLASRPEEVMSWSQAGRSRRAAPAGTWWAAVPDRDRDPAFRRDELALLARWHPQFQDRVNTLHFLGENLDETRLRADLESCLCTPLEISRWRRGTIFTDPWPRPETS